MITICTKCVKTICSNHRGICCDICDKWYYLTCTTLSLAEYSYLASSQDHWYCNNCMADILPYNNIIDYNEFMHAIRLFFSNYNFDIAQYNNLCFKPFESNFFNTENNI